MNKWLNRLIITLVGAFIIALIGCSSMQDVITPAYIEPEAISYADMNDVPSFMPWTSLWDLKRIEQRMNFNHTVKQIVCDRMKEDDTLGYNFLKGAVAQSIKDAEEFKSTIFSPEGPIGMLLPMVLGGTFGALVIKRPGDKTKKQVEEVLKTGNGNTV